MSGWASSSLSRAFTPRRYPTHPTEETTVWSDGTVVKRNCFGRIEHRFTKPSPMDAHMQEFFDALDGRHPAPEPVPAVAGVQFVDWDSGDFSL